MARAINPDELLEFVEPEDQALPEGDPFRTVWILKHLSLADQRAIQDQAAQVKGDDVKVNSGTVQLENLRRGIVGVRNFRDPMQPCGPCGGSGRVQVDGVEGAEPPKPQKCENCSGSGMLCLDVDHDRVGPRTGQVSDSFLRRIKPSSRQRIANRISGDADTAETTAGES